MQIQPFFERLKTPATIAAILRVGLGAVFIIGGFWKLSRLLSPDHAANLVATYTAGDGYINAFFQDFLFDSALGAVATPWGFLTTLSSFEVVTGLALILGLMVRPIALVYLFLLWSFVFGLPVHTVPGGELSIATFEAPAMLVQIRDIALVGFMAVLFLLGAGRFSLDQRLFGSELATAPSLNWNLNGLVLRVSLALPMLIGGVFGVTGAVPTFSTAPILLLVLGVLLLSGVFVRSAGILVALVLLWHMGGAMEWAASMLDNLNAIKREIALLAVAAVLGVLGGGDRFTPRDIGCRSQRYREAMRASR